jgi:hypothetical protein
MTLARRRGDRETVRALRRETRQLPSVDPQDPGYRRLRYSRYADDHILGFIGPKAEAEAIKDQLATFLRDELALELNPAKTLITHARTRAARYLGYEIIVQHSNIKITNGRRTANGTIALRVPLDVIKAKRVPYRQHGKPWHRPALQNLDDYDIIQAYGAEYRGIVGWTPTDFADTYIMPLAPLSCQFRARTRMVTDTLALSVSAYGCSTPRYTRRPPA